MVGGVVRWRRIDRKRAIEERFGDVYHERTIGKILKQISSPHQRAAASSDLGRTGRGDLQKSFAATLQAHLADAPERKMIGIWWQDEARIDQKSGLVEQWARRGARPRQPDDQRYESACLFGAICPPRGLCLQATLEKAV